MASDTLCWKKVWLTIAGRSNIVTPEETKSVLNLVKDELCDGFKRYKREDENSDETSIANFKTEKLKYNGNDLDKFIRSISSKFNLNISETWKVFCNYLMFEYYGKIEDIQKITGYELYNINFIKQIWLFYVAERMFMMKTLKHLLENAANEETEFNEVHSNLITDLNPENICNSLIDNFELLTGELKDIYRVPIDDQKAFFLKHTTEEAEILHCIILITQYTSIKPRQFCRLCNLFRSNSVTLKSCTSLTSAINEDDMARVNSLPYLQTAVLNVALTPLWNNYESWTSLTDVVERQMELLIRDEEESITLLTWGLLQLSLASDINRYNECLKYHRVALLQNVFTHIDKLVKALDYAVKPIARIVKSAVHTLLEKAVMYLESSTNIINYEGVPEVITKLAEDELFAIKILCPRELLRRFYIEMINMFPFSFVAFSKLTRVLLQHEDLYSFVLNTMKNFKTYTELRKEEQGNELSALFASDKSICVPPGSLGKNKVICDVMFVTFDTCYTYFTVLEELANAWLLKCKQEDELTDCVLQGYKVIAALLNRNIESRFAMTQCLNLLNSMLFKLSNRPFLSADLLGTCLDIYRPLMLTDADVVLKLLLVNDFLPLLVKDVGNPQSFFDSNALSTSILILTIHEETSKGKHTLLMAYIRLIRDLINRKLYLDKIQLPAFVFLFAHVFPSHMTWTFENCEEKITLTSDLLDILLEVLQKKCVDGFNKAIFDFCFLLVTEFPPGVYILNMMFRKSNGYYHAAMMNDPDWYEGMTLKVLGCLKKVLNIMNIVLSIHNQEERDIKGSVFMNTFLDTSTKPSSLKLLTGYMQNSFDPAIPRVACQILKKFAVNSDVAMLSLLEMDKYQLQCAFLEKLRDPLEEEQVKVAILDLITLCVQRQNGMIVAFFDILQYPNQSMNVSDSVKAFMEEYLDNIRKSTDYLYSPIQTAVLDLFHALWMYRKNMLVEDLTENSEFWLTLTEPLFGDLKLPNKTYSQILNILTYELYRTKSNKDKINGVVAKLFSINEPYLKRWSDHVLVSLSENSSSTYGAQLLRSWKTLVIATSKYCPECLERVEERDILSQMCLNGFTQYFSYPDDIKILSCWTDLYLYLITQWPENYYKDFAAMLQTLIGVFRYLGEYYMQIPADLKETVLAIAIKINKDVLKAKPDTLLLEGYLRTIGLILEKEYENVTELGKTATDTLGANSYKNWFLLLTFATHLIEIDNHVVEEWFKMTSFLNKVLTSTRIFTNNAAYFPIAKMAVQCLLCYVQSRFIDHFLHENLMAFFDMMRPPNRYIYVTELNHKNAVPWQFEEWWLTYAGIMHLMTILLKKFGRLRLETFFTFTVLHEEIIRNQMRLPRVTTEKSALQVVVACVEFIQHLLKWKQEWRLHYYQTFTNYMQSINDVVNAISLIFLRPAVLRFFTIDSDSKVNMVEHLPTVCLVEIMDGLMELLGYSCRCLLTACPTLLDMLDENSLSFTDDVYIASNFHIPKIIDDTPFQLKYGTLLCLLHFVLKTMSHIQSQKTKPKLDDSELAPGVGYLSFVCPDYLGFCSVVEKYNSLQTFAASELYGLTMKWLVLLEPSRVNFTLETLSTLLAIQTHLTVHVRNVSESHLMNIKRELCSELLYFQEFSRKRLPDGYQYRTAENVVFRKVYPDHIPYLLTPTDKTTAFYYATKNGDFNFVTYSRGTGDSDLAFASRLGSIFHKPDYFDSVKPAGEFPWQQHYMPLLLRGNKFMAKKRKTFYGNKTFDGKKQWVCLEKIALNYFYEHVINPEDYLLMLSIWFFNMCQLN